MPSDISLGVVITIFLVQGRPDGLRILDLANWSGVVLTAGVADLAVLLARPELSGPGVYLLVGRDGDELKPIYVGESDNVRSRLRQHFQQPDDRWQHVVVATRRDKSLNRAYVKWLEHKLIALGLQAHRSVLANQNSGSNSSLSESDVAICMAYLAKLLVILPMLGMDSFEIAQVAPAAGNRLMYHLQGAGDVQAEGYETSSGFVVSTGTARISPTRTTSASAIRMRQHLLESNIFTASANANLWLLSEPYAFNSPSLAASVMLGKSANGLTEWKTADGVELKSIRQREADAIAQ